MAYKVISHTYNKGERRIETILKTAEKLLIDGGYNNFSMRKVAIKSGISLGNLQYYFPSKNKLLEALLDHVIDNYLDIFLLFRKQYSPKEQLIKILTTVLLDIKAEFTTMFFPELWSMANHDVHVSKVMDDMYGKYREIVTNVIIDINPNLTNCQAKRLSIFITASLEGHTIFVGYKKPWTKEAENMIELSIQSFIWLIENGDVSLNECNKE